MPAKDGAAKAMSKPFGQIGTDQWQFLGDRNPKHGVHTYTTPLLFGPETLLFDLRGIALL